MALPYILFFLLVRSAPFRTWAQAELRERTGYDIKIGTLSLRPWFQLSASAIALSKSGEVFFQTDRALLTVTPIDIFSMQISRLSLEKPIVTIQAKDLFGPSKDKSVKLVIPSVRTLSVSEGQFILKAVDRKDLVFRSIHLSAKNLSVGKETGLLFRAYLPMIEGDADVRFRGPWKRKEIEVFVRQREKHSLPQSVPDRNQAKGILKAFFTVRQQENGDRYQVVASGSLKEFRLGDTSIGGHFKSGLDLDLKSREGEASLQWSMPKLPKKIGRLELPLPVGPVVLTLGGRYSVPKQLVTVREIKMNSPLGSMEGKGTLVLADQPMTFHSTFRIREVPLNLIRSVFPKAINALAISGMARADLHLDGPFHYPKLRGVVWCNEAGVKGKSLALSRFSFRLPFEFAKASFHAKGVRIQGRGLTVDQNGQVKFQLGRMSLYGDVGTDGKEFLRTAGRFRLAQGGFSTRDGSKIGERLNASGHWDLTHDLQARKTQFKGKAEIEDLELLWNKFFGAFKRQRPTVEIAGDYLVEKDEVKLQKMNLVFRSLGNIELKGVVQRLLGEPLFRLRLWTKELSLGGFYDFFLRDTFKLNTPMLDRLSVAGKSSTVLRLDGSRRELNAEGVIRLMQGEIREKSDKWRLGPVEWTLPFRLRYPRAAKDVPSDRPRTGSLIINGVQLGSTTIPPVKVTLTLWNNAVKVLEPIRIPIYSGSVTIKDLTWRDIVETPQEASFSLELTNIRMGELTEALGWVRFRGALSGTIPRVEWMRDSVRSKGEVQLTVFGGRVAMQEMEIVHPFSSVPSIKMNVRLEEINLERASETFEFGRLSGILQGSVTDLVITHRQPAEFKAEVYSIPRDGVGQWISVEALNKITILSSGSGAVSLYGGLAAFFDYFRYSKLGFKASLKNDKLTLRGVETKDGQDYLVVGSFFPPTVNIVSHTQEIGFSELMRRVERVKKAGAAEQHKR